LQHSFVGCLSSSHIHVSHSHIDPMPTLSSAPCPHCLNCCTAHCLNYCMRGAASIAELHTPSCTAPISLHASSITALRAATHSASRALPSTLCLSSSASLTAPLVQCVTRCLTHTASHTHCLMPAGCESTLRLCFTSTETMKHQDMKRVCCTAT